MDSGLMLYQVLMGLPRLTLGFLRDALPDLCPLHEI